MPIHGFSFLARAHMIQTGGGGGASRPMSWDSLCNKKKLHRTVKTINFHSANEDWMCFRKSRTEKKQHTKNLKTSIGSKAACL